MLSSLDSYEQIDILDHADALCSTRAYQRWDGEFCVPSPPLLALVPRKYRSLFVHDLERAMDYPVTYRGKKIANHMFQAIDAATPRAMGAYARFIVGFFQTIPVVFPYDEKDDANQLNWQNSQEIQIIAPLEGEPQRRRNIATLLAAAFATTEHESTHKLYHAIYRLTQAAKNPDQFFICLEKLHRSGVYNVYALEGFSTLLYEATRSETGGEELVQHLLDAQDWEFAYGFRYIQGFYDTSASYFSPLIASKTLFRLDNNNFLAILRELALYNADNWILEELAKVPSEQQHKVLQQATLLASRQSLDAKLRARHITEAYNTLR